MDKIERQLEKVDKIFAMMNEEYARPEEVVAGFEIVNQAIVSLKAELELKLRENKGENSSEIKTVLTEVRAIEANLVEVIQKLDGKITADLDKVIKNLYLQVQVVQEMIPSLPDLTPLETRINEVEAKIPILPEEETPIEIRDKLETLVNDDRLDKSAIKDLDEDLKRLDKKIDNVPTARPAGAKGVQVLVAGAKSQLTSQAINFIAGTNVTISSSIVNGVTTLSFSATGASANQSNNETPSGTINGVNAVFTLAHTPSPAASLKLYLNGAFQTAGGEDYTLSGLTITFVNAPVSGSILRAFYDY